MPRHPVRRPRRAERRPRTSAAAIRPGRRASPGSGSLPPSRSRSSMRLGIAREQQHRQSRPALPQRRGQRHPVHPGHGDVADQQRPARRPASTKSERRFGAIRPPARHSRAAPAGRVPSRRSAPRPPPAAPERPAWPAAAPRLDRRPRQPAAPRQPPGAADGCGSVVPSPGRLSTAMCPPDCATMPCTVARPSPVPPFSAGGEERARRAAAMTSGGMPLPVSPTSSTT